MEKPFTVENCTFQNYVIIVLKIYLIYIYLFFWTWRSIILHETSNETNYLLPKNSSMCSRPIIVSHKLQIGVNNRPSNSCRFNWLTCKPNSWNYNLIHIDIFYRKKYVCRKFWAQRVVKINLVNSGIKKIHAYFIISWNVDWFGLLDFF